jgi:uncharacterized tellurite resistance protein B-like protein
MGLLDWLKANKPATGATPTSRSASRFVIEVDLAGPGGGRGRAIGRPLHTGQWVPPGVPVRVGAWDLSGGLYVGSPGRGQTVTCALIDPRLAVDVRRADWTGATLDYWPSYSEITPGARAAFLTWASTGRNHPQAAIGYVFLHFYGLERRTLVDLTSDLALGGRVAAAELPWIHSEVTRLLSIYGTSSSSFRRYATELLAALDLILVRVGKAPSTPPPLGLDKYPTPLTLSVGLGQFASSRQPVPAPWALAWAAYHPEIWLRTPAQRCPDEFAALFTHHYAKLCGAGIVPAATSRSVSLDYRAADRDLALQRVEIPGLPDVLEQPAARIALENVVDRATEELAPYSRYLGRNPAGGLPAAALLPDALLSADTPPLRAFTHSVSALIGDRDRAVVTNDDLAPVLTGFSRTAGGRLPKSDATTLARLLRRCGLGIEPDVRFGGPAPGDGPAVLFRLLPDGEPSSPDTSGSYAAALTTLHLAAAVGLSDDDLGQAELTALSSHFDAALELSPAERLRLTAHAAWLGVAGARLTGLTKRLDSLDANQRRSAAALITSIAAADGKISPAEVRTVEKIYRMLGLDPGQAYSQLHAATSEAPTAASQQVRSRPDRPAADGLRLDRSIIAARMAQTAAVSTLLGDIFADDEPPEWPMPTPAEPPADEPGPTALGLDASHSRLARRLATRPLWTFADFVGLVEEIGLLPAGALDVLNEASIEACGEPFAEELDDAITINEIAVQEMLS